MWSLKYRIDNNAWNQRTFWRDAIAIQLQMRGLKDSNVGWQDNVVVVRQFFDELKERIPNEIGNALSIFNSDDITIGTNTSGYLLVADGTNFNPVALSGDITTVSGSGSITISNDAISLAKMAGLARGKLIYGDASGDPAALPAALLARIFNVPPMHVTCL